MTLSRVTSRSSLSEHSSESSEEQIEKQSAQKAGKNSEDSGSRNTDTPIAQTAKEKNRQATASPRLVLKPPVVRQKLTERQRSNSQPVLARPLAKLADPSSLSSLTPEGKSSRATRKSKDAESVKPSSATLSTSSIAQDPTSTTPPRVHTRKPNPARKSLTPEQQISHDLADLADKHLLRKSGRVDDAIDPSQMTLGLQKYAGKSAHATVRIDDLMMKMFGDDMKKTEAWEIARQTSAKIKTAYFFGRDESTTVDAKREKEAVDQLRFLAFSMAGAFFNVSGAAEKIRLPQPLKHFLCEMDHRQIRKLLSSDTGITMSHDAFLRARHDSLSLVLLDAFLIPLLAKEFFPARKTVESDKAMAHVIDSLHSAWLVSSSVLLKDSLDTAPGDIAELMLKRRSNQFRPKAHTKLTSLPSTATSPTRARRTELRELLGQLQKQISPTSLTPEMLKAIKAFNNEFSTEKGVISREKMHARWLEIIEAIDPQSEAALQIREWINFDQELLETDILSKLAVIEKKGESPIPDRARRLTSDRPLSPPSISTASIDYAFIASPMDVQLSPASSLEARRRERRSPDSPSSRVVQHRRTKTADAVMPFQTVAMSGLSSDERNQLIQAFPSLLLDCVKQAAMRKTEQGMVMRSYPVQEISMAGRGSLPIALDRIPRSLGGKVRALTKLDEGATTISHAKLWSLLMRDALTLSPAGKRLLVARSALLSMQDNHPLGLGGYVADADEHARKKNTSQQMKPQVDSVLADIFKQGMAGSGLPEELLETVQAFDRMLLAWSHRVPNVKNGIDELRSNLAYDLVVTRLIFPLVLGKVTASSNLNQNRLAEAVRASLKPLWDKQLFPDFMARQAAASAHEGGQPSSSTSATPHVSDTN